MKKIRIHIWFIINLTILLLFIAYPVLLKTPIWLIIVFSQFILKKYNKIKSDLTSPIKNNSLFILIIISICIIGLFIILNKYMFINIIYSIIALIFFLILIYILLLNKTDYNV